jgi:hypothetical protein
MMDFFIQIRNGKPFEHPILGDNFRQAFPHIDVNNLPPEFAKFERVKCQLGPYQVLTQNDPTYEFVGGIWKDVWHTREMTAEEKTDKQQKTINAFRNRPQAENWSAWIFDEETCTMKPPIPRPAPVEGKIVFWCGADNNWKEAPSYPTDGSNYNFDFLAWQWVAV